MPIDARSAKDLGTVILALQETSSKSISQRERESRKLINFILCQHCASSMLRAGTMLVYFNKLSSFIRE